MKNIIKKTLGFTLLLSPIIASLVLMACEKGILVAIMTGGGMVLMIGVVLFGAWLLLD